MDHKRKQAPWVAGQAEIIFCPKMVHLEYFLKDNAGRMPVKYIGVWVQNELELCNVKKTF